MVVSNPISLDGNPTFYGPGNGTGTITFSGTTTLSGTHTISAADKTQTIVLSGTITESIFGPQGLIKAGEGTLVLSGVDSYSGTTTINNGGGTLVLNGSGTIPNIDRIHRR